MLTIFNIICGEKMKTFLQLSILSLCICFNLFGQEQTLVGGGEITHGGFGGPVVKFTQIKNESAVLIGGRGGWIINHTFIIGGGGYGLATQIKTDDIFNNETFLNFGYGGLELEYIIQSDNVVHFSVYTLIGAGGITYNNNYMEDWSSWDFGNDEFFVFEPAVNVEVNITSFFRINAGANYRYISGVNYNNLNNSDLAGFAGVLTFKFGSF
jgi:hypothetical protein